MTKIVTNTQIASFLKKLNVKFNIKIKIIIKFYDNIN